MCSSSPPPAPDYKGAAEATAAGNLQNAQQTTEANRVDWSTPYGSLNYSQPNYDSAGYNNAISAYNNAMAAWKAHGSNPRSMPAAVNANAYGDSNKWSATLALDPSQQSLLDQQNKTSAGLANLQDSATTRVGSSLNNPYASVYDPTNSNSASVYDPTHSSGASVYDTNRSNGASVYNPNQSTNNAQANIMSRLQPQFDRDQSSMESKLANQGITQGSEAWNNAQNQFGQTKNDAYQQAALQGINLGQSQQQQQYQQEIANQQLGQGAQQQQYQQVMANQQLGQSAQQQQYQQVMANQQLSQSQQQQQYQQAAANRNAPINELSAIRSGSQVTNPTFGASAQQPYTGGANYSGAMGQAYQGDLNAYNAQVGQQNSMMGGLFGLGSAGLIGGVFSDIRLKENIVAIGNTPGGLPVYSFNYVWDETPQIGVMAQDVEKVNPDAVIEHPSGFKMVDYGRIQ